jgi:hypothetical protein
MNEDDAFETRLQIGQKLLNTVDMFDSDTLDAMTRHYAILLLTIQHLRERGIPTSEIAGLLIGSIINATITDND